MSNAKEIDVRVTANTSGLEKGMDKAASTVSAKSNLINDILKRNAEEAVAIARKQAQEVIEAAQKQAREVERAARDQARKAVAESRGAANQMGVIASQVRNTIIGMFTVNAAFSFVKSTINAADGLKDMSERLGVSIKDLASFKAISEQSGTSLDGLGRGLSKLSRSIGEAEAGNKELAKTLTELGITSRDPKEALYQLADATQKLENPNERAAKLTQILGRGYQELIPLLIQGGDALRDAARESASFADEMVRLAPEADRLNDNLVTLKTNAAGAAGTILTALVPSLNEYLGAMNEIIRNGSTMDKIGFFTLGFIPEDVANKVGSFKDRAAAYRAEISKLQASGKDASKEIATLNKLISAETMRLNAPPKRTPALGNIELPDPKPKKSKTNTGSKINIDPSIDVFDNGSFVTDKNLKSTSGKESGAAVGNKDNAAFIRQQFEAVNDLQRAMVKEAEKAEKEIEDARKKSSQQQIAIKYLWAKDAAAAEIAVVDAAQSAAQQQYDLGIINYQQLLAQEAEFESQRTNIRIKALNDRLLQLQAVPDKDRDPEAIAQAQIAIEELERQHQARMGEIRGQAVLEQKQPMMTMMQSVEQGMSQLAGTMLTNWKNVGQTLKGVLANIGKTIIQETIIKPLMARASAWAKEKLFTMAGIGADAAKAGSGAAASQASIPYIGPILAVAAMAAVFAAVSGMSSKVPSAAGGFDIPSGMNPLTQLHEEEMVLPKNLANSVRKMTGEGAGTQQVVNNNVTMHIQTQDADSFRASEDQISADMHARIAALSRGV